MPSLGTVAVVVVTIRESVLGAAALAGLAQVGRAVLRKRLRYRLDGFPSAPIPSIRLHLMERFGLAEFFSQLGQDKWVLGVVFPKIDDGYFLDIGAADAVDGSNSLALERAGWSGICVEPFPTGDWASRTGQLFESVLDSSEREEVTFLQAGRHGGIEDHIGHWGETIDDVATVQRSTTTIESILRRANAPSFIHYVSLDTEGSEYEILRGFPFDEYRMGALTVEHNGEPTKRRLIRELLLSKGYRFDREHVVEDWYVGEQSSPATFAARSLSSVAMFDDR